MDIRQLIEQDERPFPTHPNVGRFYASGSIEEARRRLARTIQRGDGLGLVIGAAGTGKSLLLQVLAAQFHGQFDVVLLACAQLCTRRALLQAVLFELGMDYELRSEGELRLSLLDHLLAGQQDAGGLLLLVDEAQSLPTRLLEELRVLTNLVRGGMPRVRLVLAGLPTLDESLATPDLESFSQRVAARCYLVPFNWEDTTAYIRAQVAASGADSDLVFASDACDAVFEATDGVPRLINQLCDRALWLADIQGHDRIDRATIQLAWAELQQLPAPRESASVESGARDAIEFGTLNDHSPSDWNPALFSGHGGNPDRELDLPHCVVEEVVDDEADAQASIPWPEHAGLSAAPREPQRLGRRIVEPEEPASVCEAINPFDEPFDEEELVLDSFATWDSASHREARRVHNRRDPGFSTRVREALDAAELHRRVAMRHTPPSAELARRNDCPQAEMPDVPKSRSRLAIVSEPPLLRPIPVVRLRAATGGEPYGSVWNSMAPEASDAGGAGAPGHTEATTSEDVLVVEEDADDVAYPEPSVRREQYGQLFTRLRGIG